VAIDLGDGVLTFRGDAGPLNKAFNEIGHQANVVTQAIGKSFLVVGAVVAGVGIAMTTAFFNAAKTAADYESAFAGVRKTVDATEEEFAELSDEILNLSTVIPVSAIELAKIAEIGGQLGIAKENLIEFTRTIADLAVSSNIAGESGALMVAQFMNITGTPQEEVRNLASAIVDLGNNTATTENDILELATRIAAAGELAGMTEGDILGIAAALASVGVKAAMGGTAISQTIRAMNDDFLAGEQQMTDWADVAGMTAEEFHKMWSEKPAEALAAFVLGLKKMREEGKSVTTQVEELGLKGLRLADVMGRATLSADLFKDAIHRGNTAFVENSALTEESEKRYATFQSKVQMVKNSFELLKIEVGNELLPTLARLLDKTKEIILQTGVWIKENPELTKKLVLGAAAIGVMATAAGTLLVAIGGALMALPGLVTAIGGIISAGPIAATVFGAIAFAAAAIPPIVAAIVAKWQELRPTIEQFLVAVKQRWEELKPILIETAQLFWEIAKEIWRLFSNALSEGFPIYLKLIITFLDTMIIGLRLFNTTLEYSLITSQAIAKTFGYIAGLLDFIPSMGGVAAALLGGVPGLQTGGEIIKGGIVDVHKDERIILPTGAEVQRAPAGAAGAAGGGGITLYVNMDAVHVREEADIELVSESLYDKIIRELSGSGLQPDLA